MAYVQNAINSVCMVTRDASEDPRDVTYGSPICHLENRRNPSEKIYLRKNFRFFFRIRWLSLTFNWLRLTFGWLLVDFSLTSSIKNWLLFDFSFLNICYFLDFLEGFHWWQVNKKSTKTLQKVNLKSIFLLAKVTEKVNLDKIDFFAVPWGKIDQNWLFRLENYIKL